MISFWWTVLASAVGQSAAYLFFHGFIRSYLGMKTEEDVKELFDRIANWVRGLKKKVPITTKVYNEGRLLRSNEIKRLQDEINVRMNLIVDLEKQSEENALKESL